MKNQKAINWERLSEGTITAGEILNLQTKKNPVSMVLTNANPIDPKQTFIIQIVSVRGPGYNVLNDDGKSLNKKPYKYLSCAVRKAVKKYKETIRTNKWRMTTKILS